MKKYALQVISLLFAAVVLSVSVASESRAKSDVVMTTSSGTSVSTNSAKINSYYMAYPGILPDHALYWLKMVRDKIRLLLMKDPTLKVETLILYSDKRMGASQVLVGGNKYDLAHKTAVKAELYSQKAITLLDQMEKEETLNLWKKYYDSAVAHEKVLMSIVSHMEGNEAGVEFERLLESYKASKDRASSVLNLDVYEIDEEDVLDTEGYL
ncbi:DUF5667 domain-containing protein [Patescibacteria group bacterium]